MRIKENCRLVIRLSRDIQIIWFFCLFLYSSYQEKLSNPNALQYVAIIIWGCWLPWFYVGDKYGRPEEVSITRITDLGSRNQFHLDLFGKSYLGQSQGMQGPLCGRSCYKVRGPTPALSYKKGIIFFIYYPWNILIPIKIPLWDSVQPKS